MDNAAKEADDIYRFLESQMFATGEGVTICLMITRLDEDKAYEEFSAMFGSYLSLGLEFMSRERFVERNKAYLPDPVIKVLETDNVPGNFSFHQRFHLNYA